MKTVEQLQKELLDAMGKAKEQNREFRLKDVITPGKQIYKGQGAFRAQTIKRIKTYIEQQKRGEN